MSITPGPWVAVERVDTGMWNVRAPAMEPDGWLATCGCRGSGKDEAHLMAAAPELLDACKSLLSLYRSGDVAGAAVVAAKVVAAIAKAEGR